MNARKDVDTAVNSYIHDKVKEMGFPIDGEGNPSIGLDEEQGIIDVDGVKLEVKKQ